MFWNPIQHDGKMNKIKFYKIIYFRIYKQKETDGISANVCLVV